MVHLVTSQAGLQCYLQNLASVVLSLYSIVRCGVEFKAECYV